MISSVPHRLEHGGSSPDHHTADTLDRATKVPAVGVMLPDRPPICLFCGRQVSGRPRCHLSPEAAKTWHFWERRDEDGELHEAVCVRAPTGLTLRQQSRGQDIRVSLSGENHGGSGWPDAPGVAVGLSASVCVSLHLSASAGYLTLCLIIPIGSGWVSDWNGAAAGARLVLPHHSCPIPAAAAKFRPSSTSPK